MRYLCIGVLLLVLNVSAPAQTIKEAYDFLSQERYEESIKVLDQLEPDGYVYYYLGLANYHTRRYNKSMVFYYKAIDKLPEGSWNYLAKTDLAELLRKLGMPLKARNLLHEVRNDIGDSEDYPYKFNLYFNLGLASRDLADLGSAVKEFELAKNYAPSIVEVGECLNEIGLIYQRDGSYDTSIDYFEKVTPESEKFYGMAIHNKGMSFKALGFNPIPILNEALKYEEGRQKFITLKDIGEYSSNVQTLKHSLKFLPEDPGPDLYEVFHAISSLETKPDSIKKYNDLYVNSSLKYISLIEEARSIERKHSALNSMSLHNDTLSLQTEYSKVFWNGIYVVAAISILIFLVIQVRRYRKYNSTFRL